MKNQKFKKGDLVRVAKDLGSSMSHFTSDCDAIVIGSYNDQYGGGDTDSYTLHLKVGGRCSWYYESQLTLIEANRLDLLDQWKTERKEEEDLKSFLDWIFENGESVLKGAHGASVTSLAKCFGLNNLWGNNGEGITYYSNAITTLAMAEPFLKSGDKNGWLGYCESLLSNDQGEARR